MHFKLLKMKQTYLRELHVDRSNYKNEAAILMQIHDADQLGFSPKKYSEKAKSDKQTTGHEHKEDMLMLDIFGALNY